MRILSNEELLKLAQVPPEDYGAPPHWWLRANRRVAKAQAEITWKAREPEIAEARQQGIREVVGDFGTTLIFSNPATKLRKFELCLKRWQAQLKKMEDRLE